MATMTVIKIQQLDKSGGVWREFVLYADSKDEIEDKLYRTSLAFNMDRTRVLVNGEVVALLWRPATRSARTARPRSSRRCSPRICGGTPGPTGSASGGRC
jgi:hypothetical protein